MSECFGDNGVGSESPPAVCLLTSGDPSLLVTRCLWREWQIAEEKTGRSGAGLGWGQPDSAWSLGARCHLP